MKAQDLRNSILQLAIQGKLVPQDANDEPAEVLYAKIQAEKQKLIKEGKIKKDKPLSPIAEDEITFEIPSSWRWVRLGDIFNHNTGKALNTSKQTGVYHKYITTSNVYWNKFNLNTLKEMKFSDEELEKCTVSKGDLLVCEGGDIGRAAIWDYDYNICIQNHVHKLKAYSEVDVLFYYYIFLFYKNSDRIGGKGIGIQGLSSGVLHKIVIPLPPLSEQHRIVAKIEELEQLVSQYDQAEQELSILNDKFPEQLKKSILQYAIQGKLVPQDANDEPAEVLYTKIQAEKQKLIKEGKIKKDKPLPPITDDEIPFKIPSTWKWAKLSDLGLINPRNDIWNEIEVSFIPMNCLYSEVNKLPNTNNKKLWKELKKGYTHVAENDIVLAKITPCFENGKSAVLTNLVNGFGGATTEVHVFRSLGYLNLKYILLYLKSPTFMEYATKHMVGSAGQKRVPTEVFANYYFPLPPLAEQHRIVAKVNELMQYCEDLTHPEKIKSIKPITIEWLIGKGFDSCQKNGYTDVNAIIDELGIVVMQDRTLKKGRIEYKNKQFQIWVNDLNDNWTKTHELVHYVNDNNKIKLYGAVGRKDETSLSKTKERNVDALTAEILMPENIFVSVVEQEGIKKRSIVDNTIVRKLGKHFHVSDYAIKIRLQNLGYHTK